MKKIFLIVLLLPLLSFAQEKGDNTIWIQTSDSSDVLYKKFANHLMDKGYTIEKSDKDLGYLNTGFKNFQYSFNLKIRAQIIGSKVKVIGFLNNSVNDSYEEQVYFSKNRMMMHAKAWETLFAVVSSFENTNIYYQKQQ